MAIRYDLLGFLTRQICAGSFVAFSNNTITISDVLHQFEP